jgi:hypothetical protein
MGMPRPATAFGFERSGTDLTYPLIVEALVSFDCDASTWAGCDSSWTTRGLVSRPQPHREPVLNGAPLELLADPTR